MIPVAQEPEPPDFDRKCRQPGRNFLARVPEPRSGDFERHWSLVLDDLYSAYRGICAFCARWIPRGRRNGSITVSVDHFIPKSKAYDLAYEWSNFRLAHKKLNNYKSNSLEVMDPFGVKPDWFVLDFTTFYVGPHPGLPEYLKSSVEKSIEILKLNEDDDLVEERLNLLNDYARDSFPFDFLLRRYPFVAYELQRQGLENRIKTILLGRSTRVGS